MLFALALTLLAGLSTSIGAAIAVGHRDPGPKFMAGALGLSAGVMLYVSFVEILPQGVDKLITTFDSERTGTWLGVGAFFLGIAIIAVIDRLVPEEINPHEPGTTLDDARRARLMKTGVFTAAALAFHNFPEGFATFLAGLEDASIALPVAFAIAIHNIPEGIAVAVPLRRAMGSRRKAFTWATLSGLAEPVGAVVGYLLLLPVLGDTTMGVAFGVIAGIMVFISLDELLPTAEETGEHHYAIYGLIAGTPVATTSRSPIVSCRFRALLSHC